MIEALAIVLLGLLIAWLVVPAIKILRWIMALILVLILLFFVMPWLLLQWTSSVPL
jgi:multisubunit Na+/H+ antiporter MnhB subunit